MVRAKMDYLGARLRAASRSPVRPQISKPRRCRLSHGCMRLWNTGNRMVARHVDASLADPLQLFPYTLKNHCGFEDPGDRSRDWRWTNFTQHNDHVGVCSSARQRAGRLRSARRKPRNRKTSHGNSVGPLSWGVGHHMNNHITTMWLLRRGVVSTGTQTGMIWARQ